MKPAISIIIPSFKRVQQTIRTIRLLLDSDGVGSEFTMEIIVADCTPDDSLEKAVKKKYGTAVIYTRTKKRGLSTNKNQGARTAKNELIIFCDSDIEVEKDTIRNSVRALKKHPTAGGVGGRVFWEGGDRDGKQDRPEKKDRRVSIGSTEYIEVLYGRYFATYKSLWKGAGKYDETFFNLLGESSDMSTRYWRAGYPLIYDASIKVHHVYDAPESLATRVAHPEYTIARNWFLLMLKFGMTDGDYPNFTASVNEYLDRFGKKRHTSVFVGLQKFSVDIHKGIDYFTKHPVTPPAYHFTFLDVFSDKKLLQACLKDAEKRLASARQRVGF